MQQDETPKMAPEAAAAGVEFDGEGSCPMCGGTGGWPGLTAWTACKPCSGTGLDDTMRRARANPQ